MSDYQHRSFPLGEFIAMCVALVIIFLVMAMAAGAGGGTVLSNNTVLSHNRVLSPDTTIIVNSNNTSASNNGPVISGDRSTVVTTAGEVLCADLSAPGQYNAAACRGGQP